MKTQAWILGLLLLGHLVTLVMCPQARSQKEYAENLASDREDKAVAHLTALFVASLPAEKPRNFVERVPSPSIEYNAPAASEFERARSILTEHIEKHYPVRVINAHLDAIVLCDTLTRRGIECAGTFESRRVYITVENHGKWPYPSYQLCGTFDHEFASVLRLAYPRIFPTTAWFASLPHGFKYQPELELTSGITSPRSDTMADGFLSQYSTTSVDNDASTIAELFFTHVTDGKFWTRNHSRLRSKAKLLRQFYVQVDPEFREYMTGLPID